MAWSVAATVAPPATEPVALEEAKEFVSIDADVTEFDKLLASFIAAARGHTEDRTNTRLVDQTVELLADEWCDLLRLPIGPVTAIEAISFDDRSGEARAIVLDTVELCGQGLWRGIRPRTGQGWPNDLHSQSEAIKVRLRVGYDLLPPVIKTALLLMVSDQFAFRESGVIGTVAAETKSSMRVDALLANHRIWL
ncbi:hypothetical protein E3U23_11210 [Erythrobacter litoralis]|uniref:head-tail connector protein n=1 Tax=Erythrobacter litoralis TaxID=39960 RepID=UPI002435DBCD|nr:hypothetical protein [Erythrobacter litoralis]MDG6079757.1 hypothetical protein [Erythrobacter litoralis]